MSSMRDNSRNDWKGEGIIEHINTGSLQRIADAVEIMTKDRVRMEADLKWYKDMYNRAIEQRDSLQRSLSATKGVVTRMRKKLLFSQQN